MYIYYEADIGAAIVSFGVCLQEQPLVSLRIRAIYLLYISPVSPGEFKIEVQRKIMIIFRYSQVNLSV